MTNRVSCVATLLATVALLMLVGSEFADAASWRAGIARTTITPEKPVWLAGYGSKRVPDGKLHDLWAKALALEDAQGHRAVLVSSDFQGIPKQFSDRVFAELRQKLSLERQQVMLSFSHNHCGPRLGDDLVDYYPVESEQVALVEVYSGANGDKARRFDRGSVRTTGTGSTRDRPRAARRSP